MNDRAVALALQAGLHAVSETLLMTATNPWELDAAMRAFGFTHGVCEAQDEEGLDTGLARRGAVMHPVLPRMVAEGRLGRKVGVGWYRYPGGGGLVIDPLVEDLLREEARFAGVSRRDLPDEALVARVVLALINTALYLLPKAGRARIDRMSIEAVGFPPGRSGVLSYALALGQSELIRQFSEVQQEDAAVWQRSVHFERFFAAG